MRRSQKLSKELKLTDELFSQKSSYVHLVTKITNGYKEKDVNRVRWLKFRDKHTKQNKIIDMSLLPPCKENLKPKTYSQTIWMIYFSILYLMKMITNLTANVLCQKNPQISRLFRVRKLQKTNKLP